MLGANRLRIQGRDSGLFPSHKFFDFIMAAYKEKHNPVVEFKEDAVLDPGMDFPVICMPVFKAKAGWRFGLAINVLHESVNGLINLLLTGGGKFLEAAVKAGFKFVLHFISLIFSDAYALMWNPCGVCPALFSIDQAWRPAFRNHCD